MHVAEDFTFLVCTFSNFTPAWAGLALINRAAAAPATSICKLTSWLLSAESMAACQYGALQHSLMQTERICRSSRGFFSSLWPSQGPSTIQLINAHRIASQELHCQSFMVSFGNHIMTSLQFWSSRANCSADVLALILASPCACALQTRAPRPEALLQGFWQGRTPAKGAPTVSDAAIMLVCESSGSPGFLQKGLG